MSLSFVTGTYALANWGFGAADVALIAGAGRHVCTWVMTHLKDRALFDLLQVDADTIFSRRGLIDTTELHRRWDKKFCLLANGKRTYFNASGQDGMPSFVQQMDRFTWLMTLYTAALDASMLSSDVQEVLSLLLLRLLDNGDTQDFVHREINQHIGGWRSAACVREITGRARAEWDRLGRQGKHPPGLIPRVERDGISQFLLWLMQGDLHDRVWRTASTDLFCLSVVLEELGVKIKTSQDPRTVFEESETGVLWTQDSTLTKIADTATLIQRPGMRIPLQHIAEVGSLYPRNRNEMRSIFEEGMSVIELDQIVLKPLRASVTPPYVQGSSWKEEDQDLSYDIVVGNADPIERIEGDVLRFANWLFPVQTAALSKRLSCLVKSICESKEDEKDLEIVALALDNQTRSERHHDLRGDFDYGEALSKIQMFALGYWYKLLLPLIDVSQLPKRKTYNQSNPNQDGLTAANQEAFGVWSWSDISCLNFLREVVQTRLSRKTRTGRRYMLYRVELLKIIAYLFGGSELRLVKAVKFGAIGIHGKLTTLYASTLGGGWKSFGKFSIMEIDPTCIPSSSSGIIMPGNVAKPTIRQPISTDFRPVQDLRISEINLPTTKDLTVHLEPDWEHDVQLCVLTYRQGGRVLHRLNPRQVDVVLAMLEDHEYGDETDDGDHKQSADDIPLFRPKELCFVPLHEFHGSMKVLPDNQLTEMNDIDPGYEYRPVVVNSGGLENITICLSILYLGWKGTKDIKLIESQEDLQEALDSRSRVLILNPAKHTDGTGTSGQNA